MDLKSGDSIQKTDMVYIINTAAKCAGKPCKGAAFLGWLHTERLQ